MHRNSLKVIPVWQHYVGMELETAFAKAPEDSNDIPLSEELSNWHPDLSLYEYRA
jgi:hypothetical protein